MINAYEYFFTTMATGELQLNDPANCCIQACNDSGEFYYLLIESTLGWTKFLEYGPAMPDFNELPKSVVCVFNRITFDEKKIEKKIREFLNSPIKKITQAMEVDREMMFEDCKPILNYCYDPKNF